MWQNAVKRIGISVQGIGMAWCICYKEDGIYIVEEFKEASTSFSKLSQILHGINLVYTNQQDVLKPYIGGQPYTYLDEYIYSGGMRFVEVKTKREEVESLIASSINEGNFSTDEDSLTLLKRVIKNDYLIQERETPAAQALHFGLGELIYKTSKPVSFNGFLFDAPPFQEGCW